MRGWRVIHSHPKQYVIQTEHPSKGKAESKEKATSETRVMGWGWGSRIPQGTTLVLL